MAIDHAELRRLHAVIVDPTVHGDPYWDAMYRCRSAVPSLLDEIERLNATIKEMDRRMNDLHEQVNAYKSQLHLERQDRAAAPGPVDERLTELRDLVIAYHHANNAYQQAMPSRIVPVSTDWTPEFQAAYAKLAGAMNAMSKAVGLWP